MSAVPPTLATVDLSNCDKEPIHIPGFVQPHGVLIATDMARRLTHASRNARTLFPTLPPLGDLLQPGHLGDDAILVEPLARIVDEAAHEGHDDAVAPFAVEFPVGDAVFDVVIHAFHGRVIVEFEKRAQGPSDIASFALLAHRGMSRLRNRRDVKAMLEEAVTTVRDITGFDRVMAYRFHHDDSGEIVAEARAAQLAPFIGRRFPASDIPAQARRLYTVNTLRLIADVHDEQVQVDAVSSAEPPLDLSHSVLRSVSPIHLEYLKNIDVAASMSVSIVVGGRLWGLIACHHAQAHLVPYAIRMACDVLSQVVSSSVQASLERASSARRSLAAEMRSRLVDAILHGEDVIQGVEELSASMQQVIAHDGLLFAHAGKLLNAGLLSQDAASQLLRWLGEAGDDLVAVSDRRDLPEALGEAIKPFCGVQAMRFDRINRGLLVFLRKEQVDTVTWSAPPVKAARVGPLGTRLTPNGSFAEWRQVVEGTSVPWDDTDLAVARQLLDELGRATSARGAEMELARSRLLAVLGHDLRDPLQTISMAARILEHGNGAGNGNTRVGQRIAASTGRMERLITQVLDMSRLHGGLGLGMKLVEHDMVALVRNLVEDNALTHPQLEIRTELPVALMVFADPDRLAQVVGNLLSNARHHGAAGEPIVVQVTDSPDGVRLAVSNTADPIPEDTARMLFQPLKATSIGNDKNPNGLGLGLYIASEIIRGHQGTIRYSHDGERVTFTVHIPPPARPA